MKNKYAFDHMIEQSNGNLYYLGFEQNEKRVNFIANPMDLSLIDSEDNLKVPGFGAICLSYKSEDNKYEQVGKWLDFEMEKNDANKYVFYDKSVIVKKNFKKESNKLIVKIVIKNTIDNVIKINELAISVPVNNNYSEFRYEQEYLYNNRVCEHIYPGGTCGYQIIQRLNGKPPFMYVIPKNNTSFEHVAHFPGTTAKVREGIRNFSWPGSSVIFIHAKGYIERNQYKSLIGEDSDTFALIPPKGEISYNMEIGFAESIEVFKQKLIHEGKIFMSTVPSMVSQIGNTVHLYTYSLYDVFIKETDDYKIEGREKIDSGFVWKIKFIKLGQHLLLVRNEKGNFAWLVFYIISPINELIDKRIKFITENQIYNFEGDKLNGAILPYSIRPYTGDMNIKYKTGLFVKEDSFWGNGSYEGGITEAMFIAQKNVLIPDLEQIYLLETYIRKYVRRYLQNPETNEIIWWCVDFSCTRAFEYMHVANLYYSMYIISSRYSFTKEYTPKEYLMFAFNTLMKMYEVSRRIDMTVGLMGGQNIFAILKAMQEEEMVLEYYELLEKVQDHRRKLFTDNIPYGSECAYDNTGYECVMSFAEQFDDTLWMKKLSDVILTVRGIQPVWWWHGSDIRWWDSEPDFSECCLHYTSPLNSSALLMANNKDILDVNIETLSLIYGGILGVFSKIHHDGSGSMSYCWEQESPNYGFHPFSGDIGLGLYGALLCLGSFVYYSKNNSAVGYLCDVAQEQENGNIIIQPCDGIGKRVSWCIQNENSNMDKEAFNGKIEITTGSIKLMKICRDFETIEVDIAYEYNFSHKTEIIIKCPVSYRSVLYIDGKRERFTKNSKGLIKISYYILKNTKNVKYYLKRG